MFKCTRCGACCRQAKTLLTGFDFPYAFREDGSCEQYDEKIGCKVYESRPDVCRVDVMQKEYADRFNMPTDEYYRLTKNCCNELMDKLNIENSFRIL